MTEVPAGPIDVREHGRARGAEPQVLERRLFVQLLAFGGCASTGPLKSALEAAAIEAVLYDDLHDPRGVGLLTMHEDPAFFVDGLREFLGRDPFRSLAPKPDLTMFGRTYSTGREPNLEDWLLHKTRRTVRNPAHPWALWYPLRRRGEFARRPEEEQGSILQEHGALGRAYAEIGAAADVRLACYGLDRNDNDFVIGLVGPDLHPLSHLVQAMRKTRQTSQFIEKMGPFFVGRARYQTPVAGGPGGGY